VAGPLAGLRIVEFAGIGPAPFTGMLLADMGAQVIVVQRRRTGAQPPGIPGLEPGRADIASRGKRSIAVDLRHPQALRVVLRLISQADALIEGFRPGVMERLGLGPDVCSASNPRIVYGRMTGWGQTGPLAPTAGHDLNFTALSGALHAGMRREGVPWVPPSLIADMGGGMLLAFGIACALIEARRSGKGQIVDAAMIDAAALLSHGLYSLHAAGQWRRPPGTNLLDSGAPFYDTYPCADGEWLTLAALEPPFYAIAMDKLGLMNEPAIAAQYDVSRWPEARRLIADAVRKRTRAEWLGVFEGTDGCVAPVLDFSEAPAHPHHVARGTFVRNGGIPQPAAAPRLSRTPGQAGAIAGPPSSEALAEWGFSAKELAELSQAGVL
jgi:alpha-methylacyl-CoA racemase